MAQRVPQTRWAAQGALSAAEKLARGKGRSRFDVRLVRHDIITEDVKVAVLAW